MVTAWAYGHDVSRLDTRSEGAISETGDANPRLSAEKILALPCGKTQMAMPELAPVSLDTTLSTGTEKEWPS